MTKDTLEDAPFQAIQRKLRIARLSLMGVACCLYAVTLLAAWFATSKLAVIPIAVGGMIASIGAYVAEMASTVRNDSKVIYDLLKALNTRERK